MKITAAASHFDKTYFTDAYAPGVPRRGLLDVSDSSKRDGLIDTRHIFSLSARLDIPPRSVIQIGSDAWVLGRMTEHTYLGQPVRREYPAQRTDGLHMIRTPAQLLDGVAGDAAYASRVWLKDLTDQNVASDKFNYEAFYFALSESLGTAWILTSGTTHWRVMSWYDASSGFRVAEAVRITDGALVDGRFTANVAYDPVTDTYGDAVPVDCPVLIERFQDNYHYQNAAADSFVRGDMVITVSKTKVAVTPKQGNLISANGLPWRVMDVADDGMGAWVCHVRQF